MIIHWLKYNQQYCLDISLALLVFFIPLSPAFPNILMIPAGLLYISISIKTRSFKQPVIWYLLLLLVSIQLIHALTVGQFLSELDFMKKFISGLFIFLLIKSNKNPSLIEKSYLLGIFIAITYSFGLMIEDYFADGFVDLGVGNEVYELLILERPYFAFASVLANYIIFKNIRKNNYNSSYYLLALFIVGFCFFITARLGIALHILLLAHHAYKSIEKLKIKHYLIFLSITGLILFSIFKNPYLKERMRISENIETTVKKLKAYEPRYIIWQCNFELIKDNFLVGLHSHRNLQNALDDCYIDKIDKEKKLKFYTSSGFNTHNQFFDILLVGGLLSFIVFIAALIIPFIRYHHYDQILTIFLLFTAFFLVENVLLRQTGCFLFGIFGALSYQYDRQEN